MTPSSVILHSEYLPLLLRAGLAHVQFETIHPFKDGNGRLGRLLITLMLCHAGVLTEPVLYLSLYLRTHRQAYYDRLQAVRTDGDWEGWLAFFLDGVSETAGQAVETARRLLALFDSDRERVQGLRRSSGSALRVHHLLQARPIQSVPALVRATGLTHPTVTKALRNLEDLRIARELTGQRRNRLFVYDGYLAILDEGLAGGGAPE